VSVEGTGNQIFIRDCQFQNNGQLASGTTSADYYDLNWSGTASGLVRGCIFNTTIKPEGAGGVVASVNMASSNKSVSFADCQFRSRASPARCSPASRAPYATAPRTTRSATWTSASRHQGTRRPRSATTRPSTSTPTPQRAARSPSTELVSPPRRQRSCQYSCPPAECRRRGACLDGAQAAGSRWAQVIDVEVLRRVTEWALPGLECRGCGTVTFAGPPPGAYQGSVSYGPVLNAAAVVLTAYGNVPPERAARVMAMLLGVPVSPGWVDKASGRLAAQLGKAGLDAAMLAALAGEKALAADETPVNVLGSSAPRPAGRKKEKNRTPKRRRRLRAPRPHRTPVAAGSGQHLTPAPGSPHLARSS
jgi:Transposase IS66 family